MGKKNKTFKIKEYKLPQEKYIVVVNSWGLPEYFDQNTKLNEVGAWFQLLLKKDYPEARVREIFFQKTHQNLIVVLPQEIDINKILGGYKFSDFHHSIPPEDTRTVYIYEYRYTKFGNPAKTNWTGIIPSNNNIPAGLLQILKYPFPIPCPAPLPPSDIAYARPIPQEIQEILANVRLTSTIITSTSEDKGKGKSTEVSPPSPPAPPPAPNVGSTCSLNQASTSTSTGSLFTPYIPPSHYRAHVEASLKARLEQQEHVIHELPQVKKIDPYEEEEVEKGLLRSLSPVKHDGSTSTFDDEGDYKPSSELLDLISTLPTDLSSSARKDDVVAKSEILDTVVRNDMESSSGDHEDVIVKSEIIETEMMSDEKYRPSDELLAAFAGLPNATSYEGQSIKQEPEELKFKEEPTEIQLPERRFSSFLSDRKQLPSTSRTTTAEPPRQHDNSRYNDSNVQVKPEPVDDCHDSKMSFSSNRHFPIPRDRQHSMFPPSNDGNSQSSRDPRKRRSTSSVRVIPVKNERDSKAEDEESRKRLKFDHR